MKTVRFEEVTTRWRYVEIPDKDLSIPEIAMLCWEEVEKKGWEIETSDADWVYID